MGMRTAHYWSDIACDGGYVDAAAWLAELHSAGKIRLLGATNLDVFFPRLTTRNQQRLRIYCRRIGMPDFVHLHTHTEFSLLDGLSSANALAEYAVELGQSLCLRPPKK